MKDTLIRIVLSMIKKEQIIGFIAGVVITVASGLLGMSPDAVKRAVCSAPEVKIPIK